MAGAAHKISGPEHPIPITPYAGTVRVIFNGQAVAETSRALELKEASYPPVLYIPREDADMGALRRTNHASHCPYKGDAAYYSLMVAGRESENAVWSYEEPYPAMAEIRNHLAFYPNRVDRIETA